MKNILIYILPLLLILFSFVNPIKGQGPVTILSLAEEMADRDALSRFPALPYRSLQASSYNRESVSPDQPGWFADSDGTGFIREEIHKGRQEWVLMEDSGPGCISKIWSPCFYYSLEDTIGANIRIYLDGEEEPAICCNFFELLKGKGFVQPPFADASTRAGNLYLPIPYQKGCKITLDKKSFYFIINYRSYPENTRIESFSMKRYESYKNKMDEIGSVLTNPVNPSGNKQTEEISLRPKEGHSIDLPEGNYAIQYMMIQTKAADRSQALRSLVLKMTFDGEETVACPVGDFFNTTIQLNPYQMWERTVLDDGSMLCRWIMPYKKTGKIALVNTGEEPVDIKMEYSIKHRIWDDRSMHFHANWIIEEPVPTFPLFDWNLLSVNGKGVFIGDQITVLNPAQGWWGEGDEKIYVDNDFDRKFPSHFGTGTEDYYGWAGGIVPNPEDEFSKPFLANVLVGSPNSIGYNSCSRTRVLDAIPFHNQFKFDMESSCGIRTSWFHLLYSATTFWYATPGATHNKPLQPEKAMAPILSLDDLIQINEQARSSNYIVDGAIECENLSTYSRTENVIMDDTPANVWGELSNGQMKSFLFKKAGESVSVKLTEQFTPVTIKLCAVSGPEMGCFDIFINGEKRVRQDFFAGHSGTTIPYVDLGICHPDKNEVIIQFVSVRSGAKPDQPQKLGLDFFIIEKEN